jgi:hypothetical protein
MVRGKRPVAVSATFKSLQHLAHSRSRLASPKSKSPLLAVVALGAPLIKVAVAAAAGALSKLSQVLLPAERFQLLLALVAPS